MTMCTFDGGHEYNEPFTKTFVDFFKRSMTEVNDLGRRDEMH